MLCKQCQIDFPFYQNYCRYCGNALRKHWIKSSDPTVQLSSNENLVARMPSDQALKKQKSSYDTSAITTPIATAQKPEMSVAEMLKLILASFPSKSTTRMEAVEQQIPRNTFREFTMQEFAKIETTGTLSNHRIGMATDTLKFPTSTIEFEDLSCNSSNESSQASEAVTRTCSLEPNQPKLQKDSRSLIGSIAKLKPESRQEALCFALLLNLLLSRLTALCNRYKGLRPVKLYYSFTSYQNRGRLTSSKS
ncbi:MAG: hypothetical protein JNN15_00290 [Blastocatellia bacterium]|nr:hypothetical protein [Blastocatellia bacterium]